MRLPCCQSLPLIVGKKLLTGRVIAAEYSHRVLYNSIRHVTVVIRGDGNDAGSGEDGDLDMLCGGLASLWTYVDRFVQDKCVIRAVAD